MCTVCEGNWHTNYESTPANEKKIQKFSFRLVVYVLTTGRLLLESRLQALPRLPESSVLFILKNALQIISNLPLFLYVSAVF